MSGNRGGGGRDKDGRAAVRAAVVGAPVVSAGQTAAPDPATDVFGFEMRPDGLYRLPGENKAPFRVCGRFDVIGETRPEDASHGWGLLLRWKNRDGDTVEWIMPRAMVASDGGEVRQRLASGGLDVSGSDSARAALRQYLSAVKVPARVRTVPRTGWHQAQGGCPVFVMPDCVIGETGGEVVRLDLDPAPTVYRSRGALDGWRAEVAARCVGNSRLVFGVACAFAAPLLHLIGDEGGGINLRGESSKGKTTIIDAAASVWGAPSKTGSDAFVRPWRATSNALEQVASTHNHALLPMDEMGQADPKEVGDSLYMLGNGMGKERARAAGGNRRNASWLTLVLSSSEESAASLTQQAGRRIKAGQEVRLLDVPAIVPGGFGCFDVLHGAADGGAFAQAIRRAVVAQHGTAAPAFLGWLAARMAADADFAAVAILRPLAAWMKAHVAAGVDGQVNRAARRLAVIAAAGELATEAGVTGWPAGAAAAAVGVIFRDWLLERGGVGSREDHHLFAAFRKFLALHGSARFEVVKEPSPEDDASQTEPPLVENVRTISRAGWRWQEVDAAGRRQWVHGMIPEIFAAEVAAPLGMEERDARQRLGKAGMIRGKKEGDGMRWTIKTQNVPGHGRPRLIVADPGALDSDGPGDMAEG